MFSSRVTLDSEGCWLSSTSDETETNADSMVADLDCYLGYSESSLLYSVSNMTQTTWSGFPVLHRQGATWLVIV